MNGSISQGILYKAENFDPDKKYPLIVNYYEKLSINLNVFIPPAAATGNINVPWLVSNGYLVFTPDIHYLPGEPGESACNAVISGVKELLKMPFIDKTKIGLEGHSFGGYETNYLVTGSGMFAAACAGAGVSNFITHYGSIMRDGNSRQSTYEKGQLRLDGSLWQAPEEYIKNSPVFKVNNITTPILLMNNKGDGSVPFDQGVEMLTALRRSGKKAWMLQYDGEDHSLGDEKAAMDFTIRLTQFFDHYLKDARAPEWMQDGINN